MWIAYDGSFAGFLCVVQAVGKKRGECRIARGREGGNLFEQPLWVESDDTVAEQKYAQLLERLSTEGMRMLFKAHLSEEKGIEESMLQLVWEGLRVGQGVLTKSYAPGIKEVVEASQSVGREAHKFLGFVRFAELKEGELFAKISPKHHILPLIHRHFAERLPKERWIILDTRRKLAAIHQEEKTRILSVAAWEAPELSEQERDFQLLWRKFFESVAIEARNNPSLQQQHVPLYVRENLPEFWKSA